MKAIGDILQRYEGEPFTWGSSDCLCLAADVAALVAGKRTPLDRPRGEYRSGVSAQRWLLERGFRCLWDFARNALQRAGWQEIPPEVSGVGDIGVTRSGALCVRTPRGFVARDLSGALRLVDDVRGAMTCRK